MEKNLSQALHSLFDQVEALYLENLIQDDLTAQEVVALNLLSHMDQPVIVDLALKLRISQSNITYLINKLEHKGYLRRIPHVRDKRSVHLELTDAGKELSFQNQLDPILEHVLEDQDEQALHLVQRTADLMQEQLDEHPE